MVEKDTPTLLELKKREKAPIPMYLCLPSFLKRLVTWNSAALRGGCLRAFRAYVHTYRLVFMYHLCGAAAVEKPYFRLDGTSARVLL